MVAKCCCGACSIEVQGSPLIKAICHCDNCKRRTGSAFGWSVYFADAQVVRCEGEFGVYVIGDDRQRRSFCTCCGTTLFWKANPQPGLTGVAGGCFVDDLLAEPTATVSDKTRCAWLSMPAQWQTSL